MVGGDKENLKPNVNNKCTQKGNKKNRKRKSTGKGKDKVDDEQPSTSSGSRVTIKSSRLSDNLLEQFRQLNTVKEPLESCSSSNAVKCSNSTKKKESKSGDAEAFELEEEEDKDKKKSHRNKARAEDAFAELENLTGISLNNLPSALCLRPKFESGRGGERIALLTNFFRLKLKGNMVHQYDVAFLQPDAESAAVEKEQEVGRVFRRITKRMNQTLLKNFVETTGSDLFKGTSYAFDNDRILITNRPLAAIPRDGLIFRFFVTENGNGEIPRQMYLIRIKPTVRLSLAFESVIGSNQDVVSDRAVLQVIDIICKTHAFQNYIIYGSKIFFPSIERRRIPMDLRHSSSPFELAFGYHQSTQFCQGGPMQNIDRASAVLYREGPLIDRFIDLIGKNFLYSDRIEPNDFESLKDLYFLRFYTNYRGFTKCHTIRSITQTPSTETFFRDKDGTTNCVADYFLNHYSIELQYPNLPCVEYSANRFIPIELCFVAPDQRNQRKLRDELIRIVSTHSTSQKPYQRVEGTVQSAHAISSQKVLDQFGIQLVPSPVIVQSRLLMSPKLKYNNVADFVPRVPGDWNMSDKRFIEPVALSRWALFAYQTRKISDNAAIEFVRRIRRTGEMLGMNIENPINPFRYVARDKLLEWLQLCSTKNLQLIVVFMPESVDYYTAIKSIGDLQIGVPTQVIVDRHYDNRADRADCRQKLYDPTFLCNLLMKMNMKIGGKNLQLWENNRCSILSDKTMVIGIDVNHPSPGENSPSIAAVVGSIDSGFSHYRTEIKINRSREELVRVDEMIPPILQAFKISRSCYPEHIIVYRDGVSEGQFAYVLSSEIFPLRKELEKLGPRPPKLTYIVVQKRHNGRFFPRDRSKATKSGNLLPGSVIDSEICHYKWFDFYLCSQNSFLGTARPGKYTVLWNSSPALADDLQMATYYLCYLFARATKSIADPAPARYAHHAAARGKVYLKEILRKDPQLFNSNSVHQIELTLNRALSVVNTLKNTLYFI
ncbi:protein argonaute-4-like [Panonychus citri]|uniref:protein argonaute-4-like n=1 Tax=Panonychus citri TaxID=50023 RepID=UPI002306E41E|nr:protein argonaute-4-like [Panonychus citri]